MKKKMVIISIILIAIVIIFFMRKSDEEIRARVIPNADDTVSLEVKEEVVSIVKVYLKDNYSDSYQTYYNNIKDSLTQLNELLIDYDTTEISFENHTLYNKAYNNNALKADSYPTLYVIIGDGLGSNWWGSVFPKYLGMESTEEVTYKSYFAELFNF